MSLTSQGSASESKTWVVRLDVYAEEDYALIANIDLEVYAQLTHRDGHLVLFAQAPLQTLDELTSRGVSIRLLETLHPSEPYYLLALPLSGLHEGLSSSVNLLDAGEGYLFIRTPMEEVEGLLTLGYQIRRVTPHPLVIEGDFNKYLSPKILIPDPGVRGLIEAISEDTAYTYIGDLSGEWSVMVNGNLYTILTRDTRTDIPIKKATRYAFEHFQAIGLNPYYFHYNLPGYGEKRNVVAEQTGQLYPGDIILLTAHLDSTSNDPINLAPGADDNASGAAGLMQIADVLSQDIFEHTIRYVLFTGEEQGLYGSEAYAEYVYNQGENILAVINMDMIGYNNDQIPVMDIHTRSDNPNDSALADLFSAVIDVYELDLIPQTVQYSYLWSDHYSFWDRGYPAIMSAEDFDDLSPYYHKTSDRLSTINTAYNAEIVKAVVGTAAHLARQHRPYSAYLPLSVRGFPVNASEFKP